MLKKSTKTLLRGSKNTRAYLAKREGDSRKVRTKIGRGFKQAPKKERQAAVKTWYKFAGGP